MSYANGPRIVTSGLVLYLDAGNSKSYPGTGTAWNDLSGNGNNGTLTNDPTYSSANKGSVVFDGSNDYIEFNKTGVQLGITNSGTMTAEAYVKLSSLSNYAHIIDCANNSWHLAIERNADGASAYFWNGTVYHSTSTPAIQTNSWYHIIGVQESNTIKLYINSSLATNGSISGTPPSQEQNIRIGMWQGNTRYLNGNIAIVRLYNRHLSSIEVLQNYNATKGRFGL
jgi:hypothetical protein